MVVNTGSAGSGDVIDVDGTAGSHTFTYLNGGGNGNQINVLASSLDSFLVLQGGVGMNNTIRIGSLSQGPGDLAAHGGTLANIEGAVYPYDATGSDNLVIDDSGDTAAHPNVSLGFTQIDGLAPDYIHYTVGASFTIYGGSGATVWNVNDISAYFTGETLFTGTGSDTVNVAVSDYYGEGLTVHGQGTTDILNVNDQTITDTATYAVTTTSVTRTTLTAVQNFRPEVFTLNYDGITSLAINGGSAANTFYVESTASGTSYTVNGGPGNRFDVENDGNLDGIQGPVTINGTDNVAVGQFTEDFSVYDGNSAGHTYTLTAMPGISPTANQLVRSGSAPITFSGIAEWQLAGAIGFADTFNIESLANNYLTRIYGGGLQDTFNISPTAQNLDNLSGILDLRAAPGQNSEENSSVTINDQAHTGARNWLYDDGTVVAYPTVGSGAKAVEIELNGFRGSDGALDNVVVNGGSGGNNFTVVGAPWVVPVTINAGAGVNTLVGPNVANDWTITGPNAGTLDGSVSYSSIANLQGGTGVDAFRIESTGTESSINGGGAPADQGDWLDYASFTTPITVNLATGSATNVNGGAAGAVTNIQNVYGGQGGSTLIGDAQGNILVGGSGADTITGGTGRSILIGAGGADQVTGGSTSGGDILIGGTTSYDSDTDAHMVALMAILEEWQSSDSYNTRFAEIDGGTIPGGYSLNYGTTVSGDGAANVLTGSAWELALDWFFADNQDELVNLVAGEHVNNT